MFGGFIFTTIIVAEMGERKMNEVGQEIEFRCRQQMAARRDKLCRKGRQVASTFIITSLQ